MYVCTHARTHTHTRIQTLYATHTCVSVCVRANIHVHTHTHAHAHARTHTHTYAYIAHAAIRMVNANVWVGMELFIRWDVIPSGPCPLSVVGRGSQALTS